MGAGESSEGAWLRAPTACEGRASPETRSGRDSSLLFRLFYIASQDRERTSEGWRHQNVA